MALRPARLEPQFVPRIWGARNLAPLFPEQHSLREPVGEVWLTGNNCRFADGPFAGERLGDAWPRMSDEWAGKQARSGKPFPVLVKFLFPEDKLSVQVHPDDDYAARNEAAAGGVGKTEMWYVVSARTGAEVRVGSKPEVNAERLRRAIADNSAEDLLERISVRAGDAIFVPSGTVHTIGPGMVLCEVQQNSDITYRVFDFHRLGPDGKPRELHIEKAFDVMRFGKQRGGKVTLARQGERAGDASVLVDCPYFSVAKFAFIEPRRIVDSGGRLGLIIVLEGSGTLRTQPGDASIEYARAQAWLVPSALQDRFYEPKEATTMLYVSVPEA
ncbi:MAG: type I phosphomannose isomerase catalytic subunit [Candidatus Acidiferrales bacterium]